MGDLERLGGGAPSYDGWRELKSSRRLFFRYDPAPLGARVRGAGPV